MFSRKFFCFVLFSAIWLIGCADASEGEFGASSTAGAGGCDETTGDGNHGQASDDQCGGAHCNEYDPPCFENGERFVCLCGVMLPQGTDVSCGSGGAGESGSGQGNTGNSGQGNYPNQGGSAGDGGEGAEGGNTATTSSSSSSSGQSSSSSSGTGSSGSSSGEGTIGELTITVVPPAFGTHSIIVKGDEVPYRTGGVTWGNPAFSASNTRITFTVGMVPSSKFTMSPVYDPPVGNESDPAYWKNPCCDTASMTRLCAVWATWDDNPLDSTPTKPAAKVTVEPNGYGGCQLVVVAAASPLVSGTDTDGDGFDPNAANQLQRDCDDASNAVFPGQVESPDDANDLDCNGQVNPARQVVRMSGMSAGLLPVLHDAKTGVTHGMIWKSGGMYETAAIEMRFGVSEFWVEWPCSFGTCYDNGYWNGVCHEQTGGVLSYKDNTNDLLTLALQKVTNQDTCHRYINQALLTP